MRVGDLLALIPDSLLEKIGKDVNVDRSYQKLTGIKMFKVLLYSLAETTRISLRTIECVYNHLFKNDFLGRTIKEKTRHSSLADRLSKINPDYFKSIFEFLSNKYQENLTSKKYSNIYRFDSTLISLSAKLLQKMGLNCGGHSNLKSFKVTIGQKGILPASIRFCTKKPEACEEVALKKAILESNIKSSDIAVFDRGLNAGKGLKELYEAKISFVTRIRVNRKNKVLENFSVKSTLASTVIILSDQKVQLFNRDIRNFFQTPFRLIKSRSIKTDEEIWFLTNIFTMEAYEITDIYKRRWEIEVFFKFIKQELNLKHFLVRNFNGMKVYFYMILIFAILLLVYKTSNKIAGYKFVKIRFFYELEYWITGDIIEKYGGDKNRYLVDRGLA